MELDKLPIYYRNLEKSTEQALENKTSETQNVSKFHETEVHQPSIFYKAISKILAFGDNKKQNI
jgi:hypothetical protein